MEPEYLYPYPQLEVNVKTAHQKVKLVTTTLPRLIELSKIVHKGLYDEGEEITLEKWYDPNNLTQSAKQTITWALSNYWDFTQQVTFGFIVLHNDEVVGSQTARQTGNSLKEKKTYNTGSYLRPESRGQHIGTLARWGMLAFLFDLAEVETVKSSALTINHASNQVSKKTGHSPDGVVTEPFRGETLKAMQRWKITKKQWNSAPADKKPHIVFNGTEKFIADYQKYLASIIKLTP